MSKQETTYPIYKQIAEASSGQIYSLNTVEVSEVSWNYAQRVIAEAYERFQLFSSHYKKKSEISGIEIRQKIATTKRGFPSLRKQASSSWVDPR